MVRVVRIINNFFLQIRLNYNVSLGIVYNVHVVYLNYKNNKEAEVEAAVEALGNSIVWYRGPKYLSNLQLKSVGLVLIARYL